jgi:hypothetical protein
MTATKICKVCGKEYEYCHTVRHVDGVFRYQDVACCPEHGSIYLQRVIASRAEDTEPVKKAKKSAKPKETRTPNSTGERSLATEPDNKKSE